jgi:hypothetical protein
MDDEQHAHSLQLTVLKQLYGATDLGGRYKIPLDISYWNELLEQAIPTNDVTKVETILQYFVYVGTKNGLQDTPAVQKLNNALQFTRIQPGRETSWQMRYSHSQEVWPLQQNPQITINSPDDLSTAMNSLMTDATCNVPLFNIWDSISLLYTLCVEPVSDALRAELHLYQFRTIIRALAQHPYFAVYSPSTTAATWPNNFAQRCHIAFFTTCAGRAHEKREMAKSRLEFVQSLIKTFQVVREKASYLSVLNPASCPEYVAWILTCRQAGNYSSLCFNVRKDAIYRFCAYCETLRVALEDLGIIITDLWDRSSLGVRQGIIVEDGYDYRDLVTFDEAIKLAYSV